MLLSVSFETMIAFLSGLDCFSLSFPEYDSKDAPRILYTAVRAGRVPPAERALGEPWWSALRGSMKCAWTYVCVRLYCVHGFGCMEDPTLPDIKGKKMHNAPFRGPCLLGALRRYLAETIHGLFLLWDHAWQVLVGPALSRCAAGSFEAAGSGWGMGTLW